MYTIHIQRKFLHNNPVNNYNKSLTNCKKNCHLFFYIIIAKSDNFVS